MNTFNIIITNIANLDWDEIKLKINKLAVENNDTLWMEIFPNHENHINFSKRNTYFVLNVIKPNFHGMGKIWHIFKSHMNQKTKNKQFSIDSILSHMGEITVKRAKGAKVKVVFQGLHMTCVILALVYNLKFLISNTPLRTTF